MKKLFVPGRLCLFGEHTDWAGHYRTMNADILPGASIVTGIEQGIYAEVEKSPIFEMYSDAPEIEEEWSDFSCRMNEAELKHVAKSGSFFCYCAGVASYMLEWYKVGGVRIRITSMTLPMKSGLSSSAAICVLVARAFNQLYKLNLNTLGEMNIAYLGEIRTSSRCGRLDQACAFGVKPNLMTFDGDEIEVKALNVKKHLYWVFADLCAEKDTIKILADLNKAYPFASNEAEENLHKALGEWNQDIVNRAIQYMATGNAEALGKLMTEAEEMFDKNVGRRCSTRMSLLCHQPCGLQNSMKSCKIRRYSPWYMAVRVSVLMAMALFNSWLVTKQRSSAAIDRLSERRGHASLSSDPASCAYCSQSHYPCCRLWHSSLSCHPCLEEGFLPHSMSRWNGASRHSYFIRGVGKEWH